MSRRFTASAARSPRGMLVAVVVASFVGCTPVPADAAPPPTIDAATLSRTLETLADKVSPGVVHIEARGYPIGRPREGATAAASSGSGVVVSTDGWIVTNAHVVLGAQRVLATVSQAPVSAGAPRVPAQLPARVVGMDLDSDIAVLKVEAKGLHALELGESDVVRPGQLVLAFGSPLGLQGSVSMGVVGAVDRQPDPDNPIVYIQSDAAINPGNSGGPLINAAGKVIGINTFIVSTTGGNQGLGFAVPSDIVASVFEQVRDEGGVWHGAIGVNAQSITPALAVDLQLSRVTGALVSDVAPGGPAARGGLRTDDIIVGLDGDRIETARELRARIHATRPGHAANLEVVRGDDEVAITVRVAARPGDPSALLGTLDPKKNLVDKLGAVCVDLSPQARELGLAARSDEGVLVLDAAEDPSAVDLLLPGDILVAVARRPVADLAGLRRALDAYRPGTVVALRIERAGQYRYVRVELR